ncbi:MULTISPECIES: Arc family DNA-binding protein [Pseudomonas]|uniref:Arc family DNA-binding protein n=1 Tax=Pseudomonas proteolytica TaxID=219574 RepID=A0AAW5A7E1_9PSED|nr:MULTISPECIES: Arc family DNA-binding protein [Pseudomonas]KAA8704642.1 Arc family DNA-binding protein [Pseudomonas proteolytica]MBW9235827.1 Arc family DNA-binding protein [Pseudomonas carnis]MCF5059618.1 Arc family DNA-binding protein [Pseudomonas proteolytica]MCF5099486.1 Arc family DNA-binding protein [Pseudomonas proteolytica]NMZ06285.1 Arc family DNA-binding protein [Pseudomonas proteolytica]
MSNKPKRQHEEKFVVRLPDGMRERIAVQARENTRSMNSEIVHRLESTVELEAALDRALKIIDQLLAASPAYEQPGARV